MPTKTVNEYTLGILRVGENEIANQFMVYEVDVSDLQEVEGQTDLFEGKDFDGVTHGKFRPANMGGRIVNIKQEWLAEIVENTQKAIEATVLEDGSIWGLPIDAAGHDPNSGAAGWIVAVALEGDMIRITPKWTEKGVDQVGKGEFKFFSGSIDLTNKVMWGGTLTNWPAMRDSKTGEILVSPIELSDNTMRVKTIELQSDESLDGRAQRVRSSFYAWANSIFSQQIFQNIWVVSGGVFEDYVVIELDGEFFRVDYEENEEDDLVFADQADWMEVRRVWVEAQLAIKALSTMFKSVLAGSQKEQAPDDETDKTDGDDDQPRKIKTFSKERKVMAKKKKNGKTPDSLEISVEQLAAFELLVPRLEDESDEDYVARVQLGAELSTMEIGVDDGELTGEFNKLVQAQVTKLRTGNAKILKAAMAEMEQERLITEFAISVTGGDEDDQQRFGVPLDRERLIEFMGKFDDPEDLTEFQKMLKTVIKHGVRDYGEFGDSRERTAKKELDAEMGEMLISHLEDGGSMAEFFKINSEGDNAVVEPMAEYDLTGFEKHVQKTEPAPA